MLEESKEYQPHTHTCEPHSFFLQLLKCLIIFSASGSSPSPGAGLTGLSARSLPLSLYHLSSHILICSDSPDGIRSSTVWSGRITCPFGPCLLSVTLSVCLRLKALSRWDLVYLGFRIPSHSTRQECPRDVMAGGVVVRGQECGPGRSWERMVLLNECWPLTGHQALGSMLDNCLSQSSAKLSDV